MALCKRCKTDKALVKAHIIPKAFWKIPDQKLGPLAMVSNLPGWRTTPSPIGPYDETILCEECDGFIGRFDQHATENLLRDRSNSKYQDDLFGLYRYQKADPKLIISFVASLAWRASRVSPEQIDWADIIFVMEKSQRTKLATQFRKHLNGKRVICLDIPDKFTFMRPELVELLEKKVRPLLSK